MFSSFPLAVQNPSRRPWCAHHPWCLHPAPPRWTPNCPIRENKEVLAANRSRLPVSPRRWVEATHPKALRVLWVAWDSKMDRAWILAMEQKARSRGNEVLRLSPLSRGIQGHPIMRGTRKVGKSPYLLEDVLILSAIEWWAVVKVHYV